MRGPHHSSSAVRGRLRNPARLLPVVIGLCLLTVPPVDADVPPIPARIGGTVTVNGSQLTRNDASGYRFVVTQVDGSPFSPAAESTGLNDYDWYLVDIPIYDATTQPGGAQPGQTARIHVYNGSTELDVTSPSSGQFTVGPSGSTSQINITATGGGTCTYNLSTTSSSFGPAGGTGSFTVFTASYCSWSASSSAAWINITSGSSGTGNETVHYTVAANSGPMRTGSITAGGRIHSITQQAPYVPANFVMSNPFPDIGEVVTFTVDSALEVASWDFGQVNCRGANPVINCTFLPTGTCNSIQWTYPSAGEKTVTMVLADGRQQTKHPTVRNQGECCQADGPPDASFTISASQVHVGETVTFTDTSSKARDPAKALGFSWNPTNPEIGERVVFTLLGVTGDITRATWDFGGTGCAGASAAQVCTPGLFDNCTARSFTYASSGTKYVTVTVELAGGGSQSAGPMGVVVQNAGACDGGGDSCSYSLSPSSATFPAAGGSASFAVNTASGCSWTATTSSNWLYISSNSGNGSGSVNYVVTENSATASRIGYIQVEGRSHRVSQSGQAGGGDTAPTTWFWKVSKQRGDGTFADEATATDRTFTYRFSTPGTYRITLTAGNCSGSDTTSQTIQVLSATVEDFVFPAAISSPGLNNTRWESDFRFFNPCGEYLDVRLEYEPEGTSNAGANLVFREFQLQAGETRMFSDLTEAIPGLIGEELSGSLRIESSSSSGCKVLSVSRTFNDTPYGSLGLSVPVLPVGGPQQGFLDLTGLLDNSDYRTNLRLVNYGEEDEWVPIFLYDSLGNEIGESRSALVRARSSRQINAIAAWLGVDDNLGPFSVRIDATGFEMQAFATVVDNITGDSVLFMSSFKGDERVWAVGVASTAGVNDSYWRTDVWLYNPTEEWLQGQVEFVVGTSPADVYGFEWPDLKPHRVRDYLDIVDQEFSLSEISGYLVLTGANGGPAPQVAARTYNLDPSGGTYGLNLRTFTASDLLYPGDTGYIVGISNSADQSVGFRTNLGLLNTDRSLWTGVRLTFIDISGSQIGPPQTLTIAPGALRQFNIAQRFGVEDVTGSASIKIEVTEGGGVAAYATEIDNRTQDSIFIPAQKPVGGW